MISKNERRMVLLQIYCGNGKGKTTAAAGLAVRAKGAGLPVAVFQFLKNGTSSEISELQKLEIRTECCAECSRFTFLMDDDEKAAVNGHHNAMLLEIKRFASENEAPVIIMDEFLDAYNKEMLDRRLAEEIIKELSVSSEIVLTGRNPSEIFCSMADYISEISEVKHPYQKGITARKGIEY